MISPMDLLTQFLPFGKPKGLALKHMAVEAVQASGDKLSLSIRVPVRSTEDGPYLEAIEQALDVAQFKKGKIAVSIPSQDVLLRFFSLPLLPRSEWQAAIKFEARKHIPFRTEELVWDYHAVEERSRKQIAVVFVGVRKDRFERTRRLLREAGVEPSVIEPQSISLSRAVGYAYPKQKQEFIGVVELDEDGSSAHIGIVRAGLPHLARDVTLRPKPGMFGVAVAPEPKPSQTVPDIGISVSGDSSEEGADPSVWVASTDTPITAEPDVAANTIEPPVASEPEPAIPAEEEDQRQDRLLSELRLSLDFFTREYPAASINRLVIYGDPETVAPWCAFLTEQLHVPVEPGEVPLTPAEGVARPSVSSAGLALQGGSAGPKIDFLARSALSKTAGSVDIKKDEITEQAITLAQQGLDYLRGIWKPLIVQALVAVVLIGAATLYSRQQVAQAEAELRRVQAAPKTALPGIVGEDEDALIQLTGDLSKKLRIVQRLLEQRVSLTEKWESLAENLPDGFWVRGLQYASVLDAGMIEQVEMTLRGACHLPGGEGNELEKISEFSDLIGNDTRFSSGFSSTQVEGISMATDQPTQLSYRMFTLNCESNKQL